jgi:hypothetical protein
MMQQQDEVLALLADLYARRFLRTDIEWKIEVYESVRDIFRRAASQQDAYEQLVRCTQNTDKPALYEQAVNALAQVIAAGGVIDPLVIGVTDGFRHLCLTCSADPQNVEHVRFFQPQDQRYLLAPEVRDERRSFYDRCQCCLQPLNSNTLVLFAFAGTQKHTACQCGACNRAGIARVLQIYALDQRNQQVLLPAVEQVVAPSKERCMQQAIRLCWQRGWYIQSPLHI